jgi:hypothetical protein
MRDFLRNNRRTPSGRKSRRCIKVDRKGSIKRRRSVRKKEERSGIGLLFEVLAWALGAGLPSSHEIDNFDGTVTVIETKYRTETRYHTYQVNEVTQTLSLDWNVEIRNATGANDGRLLSPYQFKDQHRLVSDEHGVRFPDASLFPETRKTLHPGWFTKRYGVEIEAWRQVLAVPIYGK